MMFTQVHDNIIVGSNDIRALSKISRWRSIVTIMAEWLIIAVAIALSEHIKFPALYIISWLIVGSRMYALYSLLHDGMHYLLFPQRQINDWLCRLFLAWPLFISLPRIRKFHLAHHKHLKTPDDPEFAHLAYKEFQFPQSGGAILATFLKDITGFNFLSYKFLKLIRFISSVTPKKEVEHKKTVHVRAQYIFATIVYYTILFSTLIYCGLIGKFFLYWIVPYITIYQALNRLRLSTEHFHIPEHKVFQTRTVDLNYAEKFIFSPHNLGFHAEHHLYPSVPFYYLPALHKKLMNTPYYRENIIISKSYLDVIKEYIN